MRGRTNLFANPHLVEPTPWRHVKGENHREAVLDTSVNPPRVVRYVGWRNCLSCTRPFWSEDMRRLWMCRQCKYNKDE